MKTTIFQSEKEHYYIVETALGDFWPCLDVYVEGSNNWCSIIIRDSNPFKTFKRAETFINKQRLQKLYRKKGE